MKQILFLVIIVSIISIVGCEDNEVVITDKEGSSAIAGIVVDSVSQLPIDSVALFLTDTVGNNNSYSDSLGAFQVPIWGGGVKSVFFKKEGYNTKFQDFNFSDNPTDLKVELVIQ